MGISTRSSKKRDLDRTEIVQFVESADEAWAMLRDYRRAESWTAADGWSVTPDVRVRLRAGALSSSSVRVATGFSVRAATGGHGTRMRFVRHGASSGGRPPTDRRSPMRHWCCKIVRLCTRGASSSRFRAFTSWPRLGANLARSEGIVRAESRAVEISCQGRLMPQVVTLVVGPRIAQSFVASTSLRRRDCRYDRSYLAARKREDTG